MSDDPKDVIEFAIRSAFLYYPKEDDPDWRSPHWIKPKECAFGHGRDTRITGQGVPNREELIRPPGEEKISIGTHYQSVANCARFIAATLIYINPNASPSKSLEAARLSVRVLNS